MKRKKETVTLYIDNNTASPINVSLFGNPEQIDNANVTTKYKWDLTGLSFTPGNITSLVLQYKATGVAGFTNFTYTGSITSFEQLLSVLNSLGTSIFYQLDADGYTYLASSTELYVYGDLQLLPGTSYAMTFRAATTGFSTTVAFQLFFASATNLTIDWGDGSAIEIYTGIIGAQLYVHAIDLGVCPEFADITFTFNSSSTLSSLILSSNDNFVEFNNVSAFSVLATLDCSANELVSLPSLPASMTLFDCSLNNLVSSDINTALIALDGYGLSGGTFVSNSQDFPAPPTGAGITAANNLISKGWTVTTD